MPEKRCVVNRTLNLLAEKLCRLSLLASMVVGSGCAIVPALNAQQESATGAALSSIMNVRRAPAAKGMGVFQASFLDALKPDSKIIQLAIVIDTTESMSSELVGIRGNLPHLISDLYQIMDGSLETTVVSFADVGHSEFPVSLLSPGFSRDQETVISYISQLKTNTGKPYFPEPIDLGVFTAVEKLNWSEDENVQKWILLLGDAPPYDSGFAEDSTKARRWHETDVLIQKANNKGINIHSMLCMSRQQENAAYEATLDKTRQFLNRLSEETGGLMIDLSYKQVQENLLASASQERAEYTRVGYITQNDIDQIRHGSERNDDAPEGRPLKVVVLPFLKLNELQFSHKKPEVQIAAQLRQALRSIPQTRTASTRQVENEFIRLQGGDVPEKEWYQTLLIRLRADYVVHGELLTAGGQSSATMRIYGPDSVGPLVEVPVSGPNNIGLQLLTYLRDSPHQELRLRPLRQNLHDLDADAQKLLTSTSIFADLDDESLKNLLGAFEALEQALDLPVGDRSGRKLLLSAEEQLTEFLLRENQHAFAHALLASCLYNQAQLLERDGSPDLANARYLKAKAAIRDAIRFLRQGGQSIDRLTRLEIEADYKLLVENDFTGAIQAYEEIINYSEASPVHPALRAHWMLAGIRSGDWEVAGNDPSVMDVEKSRQHLMQILAWWPESAIAQTIKRNLLWNEQNNKSGTPYLPREANLLVTDD